MFALVGFLAVFFQVDGDEDELEVGGGSLVEPVVAAEDFAEYQQEVEGMFMFLGVNGGRGGAPLHSSKFDFDEEVLLVGAEAFKRILESENYA